MAGSWAVAGCRTACVWGGSQGSYWGKHAGISSAGEHEHRQRLCLRKDVKCFRYLLWDGSQVRVYQDDPGSQLIYIEHLDVCRGWCQPEVCRVRTLCSLHFSMFSFGWETVKRNSPAWNQKWLLAELASPGTQLGFQLCCWGCRGQASASASHPPVCDTWCTCET